MSQWTCGKLGLLLGGCMGGWLQKGKRWGGVSDWGGLGEHRLPVHALHSSGVVSIARSVITSLKTRTKPHFTLAPAAPGTHYYQTEGQRPREAVRADEDTLVESRIFIFILFIKHCTRVNIEAHGCCSACMQYSHGWLWLCECQELDLCISSQGYDQVV